jgi:hypothetical protein
MQTRAIALAQSCATRRQYGTSQGTACYRACLFVSCACLAYISLPLSLFLRQKKQSSSERSKPPKKKHVALQLNTQQPSSCWRGPHSANNFSQMHTTRAQQRTQRIGSNAPLIRTDAAIVVAVIAVVATKDLLPHLCHLVVQPGEETHPAHTHTPSHPLPRGCGSQSAVVEVVGQRSHAALVRLRCVATLLLGILPQLPKARQLKVKMSVSQNQSSVSIVS